jgi:hypothetical protein
MKIYLSIVEAQPIFEGASQPSTIVQAEHRTKEFILFYVEAQPILPECQ